MRETRRSFGLAPLMFASIRYEAGSCVNKPKLQTRLYLFDQALTAQLLGLDLQHTGEATIWKLEVAHRRAKAENYTAAVGGFEHSLPAFESGAELGLLGEYHFDTRGEVQTVPFQNDVFIGARLALNDEASSELLGGVFYDLDNESTSLRLEASRRIGDGLKLNVEAQVFTNVDAADPLNAFAKDDYIQIELQKFF